jgi:hypothetical protein
MEKKLSLRITSRAYDRAFGRKTKVKRGICVCNGRPSRFKVPITDRISGRNTLNVRTTLQSIFKVRDILQPWYPQRLVLQLPTLQFNVKVSETTALQTVQSLTSHKASPPPFILESRDMIELEMTQAFAEDGRLLNASSRAILGVNVDRTIFRIQVGVRNLSKINDFILHWQTKN